MKILLAAVLLCTAALAPDDAAAIAAQKPLYPLTTCPISGQPLGSGGMVAKDYVHDGQLVVLCCGKCKGEFDKAPEAVMKKVQDGIVAAQKAGYPIETCPVTGEKLDDGAKSFVVASKLFRVCCGDCKKDVQADPAKFTAMLDAAYVARQEKDYPLTTCVACSAALGDKPVKLLHGTTLVELCSDACVAAFQKEPKVGLAKVTVARAAKPAAAPEKPADAPKDDHSGHGH